MTTICRIIGGAGVGKTSHMIGDRSGRLGILGKWIEERSVNPYQVGYCSFTRAARSEAAERAAMISGEPKSQLENNGWFRTVHSIAYKQLAAGKALLTDDKESRKWIADALGISQDAAEVGEGDEEPNAVREAASDEANALALWDVARAKLEPLEQTWAAATAINEFLPDWDLTLHTVETYEQMKRLDGRVDFSDLLGRFSGVRFAIGGHALTARCEGEAPDLKLWFFDEWQDASALLDRCARRLAESADVVYVAGDPFQSIYSFGGSSSRHMMSWPISEGKERVLRQSFRCPRVIQQLGETILKDCTDYWDREILPRDEEGEVAVELFDGGWANEVDPREPWLVIARSNAHVKRMVRKLDAAGVPWVPTRGMGGRWAAPTKRSALLGLISLESDKVMSAGEWTAALKYLPSKIEQGELLIHGAKAEWKRQERASDDLTDTEHLVEWGATPLLCDLIRRGEWASLVDNGQEFREAWQRWGHEAVLDIQVQAGTIHSVKGAEAPNVVLLTTTSRQCTRSMEFEETANEERRVAYVGVTRSGQKLIVLRERCLHQMDIPV